jgi:hypothetical protein
LGAFCSFFCRACLNAALSLPSLHASAYASAVAAFREERQKRLP